MKGYVGLEKILETCRLTLRISRNAAVGVVAARGTAVTRRANASAPPGIDAHRIREPAVRPLLGRPGSVSLDIDIVQSSDRAAVPESELEGMQIGYEGLPGLRPDSRSC
jgi:hypothetical protein